MSGGAEGTVQWEEHLLSMCETLGSIPEPQKLTLYHLILFEFYLYQSVCHGFILLCVHMCVHMSVKTRGQQLSTLSSSYQCISVERCALVPM